MEKREKSLIEGILTCFLFVSLSGPPLWGTDDQAASTRFSRTFSLSVTMVTASLVPCYLSPRV